MALSAVLLLSGCSSSGPHPTARKTPVTGTTLLQADDWTPPQVSGPPSPAGFCAVLTAMYRHEAELPLATAPVKEQILRDYVNAVPQALALAPADIAPAARTYLTSVATILSALVEAGLDYRKIKRGTLTPLLLDPQIKAAGNQVLAYSQTQCHYAIGGF